MRAERTALCVSETERRNSTRGAPEMYTTLRPNVEEKRNHRWPDDADRQRKKEGVKEVERDLTFSKVYS